MNFKRYKKIGKIVLIVFVLSILMVGFSNVNAAINSYGTNYTIDDTGLDESMENSTILSLIGRFIYAIGRLLEWILGTIFEAITGNADFPWADKIVFNAVPILDVNFINPDTEGFLGKNDVQKALSNTYATIFSLSISFFTVFVMISAIKLAISTISEQKAKYKKALMDWALGLIMLFAMHYFISFIFYLNEQLVEVASDVATTSLATAGQVVQIQQSELAQELMESLDATQKAYLEDYPLTLQKWITLDSSDSSLGIHNAMKNEDIMWDRAINDNDQKNNLYQTIKWISESCPDVDKLKEIKQKEFYYKNATMMLGGIVASDYDSALSQTNYNTLGLATLKTNLHGTDVLQVYTETLDEMIDAYENSLGSKVITDRSAYGIENTCGIVYTGDNWTFEELIDDLISLKKETINDNATTSGTPGGTITSGAIITQLATYFKLTSFDMKLRGTDITGATKDTANVNLTNAMMYAIIVAQSLILFIAYIKRLFYVVILGMISPAVVAYDFFKRFGK